MSPEYLAQLEQGYQAFVKQTPKQTKKKKSFLVDNISTAGGILGGIVGLRGGVAGAGLGSGAGSALGEALENVITGDPITQNVYKEGAIGGVLGAGPLKLLKASGITGKVGAPTAAKSAVTSARDKAATNLLKLTPAQTQKLLDAGVDPTQLAQKAAVYGRDAASIIGSKGNEGPLQATIKALEDGISTTTRTTGANVRIPGDELIKTLKKEAAQIKKELGGGPRLKAINQIIQDAEKKYAKGITVREARNTLRTANMRFGQSVLDDTGDAVARAAQKLEANVLRGALRTRYPSIGQALDDQSELIQLREILKRTRAVEQTGKFAAGRFDLTRPGTFIDPLLNSRTASKTLLKTGSSVDQPVTTSARGVATRLGVGAPLINTATQPSNLEDALIDTQSLENKSTTSPSMAMPTNMDTMTQNIGSPYTQDGDLSSPLDPSNLEDMVVKILNSGGTVKEANEYIGLVKTLQDLKQPKTQKPQSAESAKITSNAEIGLQALADLENTIANNPNALRNSVIPGRGIAGGVLGRALGTQEFDAARQQIIDVIARLRTGAAITNDEARRFTQFLPVAADSPEVQAQKLGYLRSQFEDVLNRTGVGSSSIEDALMSLQ